MDASNSQFDGLHVRAFDLRQSHHHEDRETADRMYGLLHRLVDEIKPVLRYVCAPADFCNGYKARCVRMGEATIDSFGNKEDGFVYLTEKGAFIYVRKSGKGLHVATEGRLWGELIKFGTESWALMEFDDLLKALQALFKRAEARREEHLQTVRQRTSLLEKLCAVVDQTQSGEKPCQPQ